MYNENEKKSYSRTTKSSLISQSSVGGIPIYDLA